MSAAIRLRTHRWPESFRCELRSGIGVHSIAPHARHPMKLSANHLKRYWEPRMRRQIITYYEERQGAGLSDLALRGVGLLAATDEASTPGL